jgi:predicted nucleic acid-binding protein
MIFVDAGYLIALVKGRDRLHRRAKAWAHSMPKSERLLTTEYVLCEAINGLSRGLDRPKVQSLVGSIEASPLWEVVAASPVWFRQGLEMHRQYGDKEWSLTDCISFLVMRERGIVLALTQDHHFQQAGFEALLRRDPP